MKYKNTVRHLFAAVVLALTATDMQAQNITVNLENEAVRRYMTEVHYESLSDESQVEKYKVAPPTRPDQPNSLVIALPDYFSVYTNLGMVTVQVADNADFDSPVVYSVAPGETEVVVHNLIPQQTYYYRLFINNIYVIFGDIQTEGQVRMIYAPSISNVRDMGGWTTSDGKRVRYGKIFRGSELNGQHIADATDLEQLRQLGIGAELDLRAFYEEENGVSAFGFLSAKEVGYGETPSYLYTSDSGQIPSQLSESGYLLKWRQEFQFIIKNLKEGRAVYQHCRHGADRTGYLSLLLEGLLGVTYDGLVKDFELTTFAGSTRLKQSIDEAIAYIMTFDGSTLQEKFNTFFVKRIGVGQRDIDYFCEEMLEGTGSDVTTGIALSSVGSEKVLPVTYDFQGRRLPANRRGLVIERTADGHFRKLLK